MDFRKIREDDLEMILRWRTSEEVTRYMYTDIPFNMEKQKKWYEVAKDDPYNKYWIIWYKDVAIGLISLNDIDYKNKRTSFGYYLGDNKYSMIAGRIHPYLYNYVFRDMAFNKIYGEVMAGNIGMMKMHEHYGLRQVGIYKEHIEKYGSYHDVYAYEILAEDWLAQDKYKKFVGNFE